MIGGLSGVLFFVAIYPPIFSRWNHCAARASRARIHQVAPKAFTPDLPSFAWSALHKRGSLTLLSLPPAGRACNTLPLCGLYCSKDH
jgi:hypothetical protein